MSIRGKLLASFGTFVLLGLIVGVVVMKTSSRFAHLTEEAQASSQLNTSIKGLEVDHLRWRGKVVDAIATNAPEIGVQTDDHKCRMGKFLYDGALDGIMAEDPELGQILSELKSPHAELHGSAKAIESVWTPIHPGLAVTLLERLNDHFVWSGRLNESVLTGQVIEVQVDPTKCKFGKWLGSPEFQVMTRDWPEFRQTMKQVVAAHERLHDSAKQMQGEVNLEARRRIYKSKTEPALDDVVAGARALIASEGNRIDNQNQALEIYQQETLPSLENVAVKLAAVIDYGQERVQLNQVKVAKMRKTQSVIVIMTTVAFFIAGIILSWLMSRMISVPLARASAMAVKIGKGNTTGRLEVGSRDEIGQLSNSMNKMADGLEAKSVLAGRIAGGDLTVEVELASSEDLLGQALHTMVERLKETIGEIQEGAMELNSGAGQVANASQVLSQGATESAASLEEISASLTEINQQVSGTAENAEKSLTATRAVQEATINAESSVLAMNEAMEQINAGSEEIGKVIKVIDDIAFQTNLLALNAAVEAARAGKHGKGFAVVAEEVRNLAGRSAKAARETSTMIGDSIGRAGDGAQSLDAVNSTFAEINKGIEVISELTEGIAQASNNQAKSISQITEGTKNLDITTQSIAATSEESAAAAEELSAIAATMNNLAGQFHIGGSTPQMYQAEEPKDKKSEWDLGNRETLQVQEEAVLV